MTGAGDVPAANNHEPSTSIAGVHRAVDVATGEDCACALLEDATVQCWGSRDGGCLGIGTNSDASSYSESARAIAELVGVTKLSIGNAQGCAVLRNGGLRCWGGVYLGSDHPNYQRPTDTGLADVVDVSVRYYHTCVRFRDGASSCWGDVTYGGGGYSGMYHPDLPEPASLAAGELPTFAIAAGALHDCAIRSDHRVLCWGQAINGKLGLGEGTISTRYNDVRREGLVIGIDDVVAISAGESNTCAVRREGTVWCWGAGMGSTLSQRDSDTPVLIPNAH